MIPHDDVVPALPVLGGVSGMKVVQAARNDNVADTIIRRMLISNDSTRIYLFSSSSLFLSGLPFSTHPSDERNQRSHRHHAPCDIWMGGSRVNKRLRYFNKISHGIISSTLRLCHSHQPNGPCTARYIVHASVGRHPR